MERVVATGVWLYDGTVPTPVRVVEVDYDFWYEVGLADDEAEPGETPDLNDDGRLYYIRYRPGWNEGDRFWPDSGAFRTIAQAVAAAEREIPGPVRWQRLPAR